MKKALSLILALIMIMSFSSGAFAAEDKITLTFVEIMTSPERTLILESFIDKYEETHPNISIEMVSPPYESAETKAAAILASGQPVDIVEIRDMTVAPWIQNGFLLNLNDYVAAWEDKAELSDAALDISSSFDATAYFLPQFIYVKGMLVRTDILKELGVTEMPTTLDEFYEVCKSITDPSKGQYGYALRGIAQPCKTSDILMSCEVPNISPENVLFTTDGDFYLDTEGGRKAAETYYNIFNDCCPPDAINWGYNEGINGFVSGTTPFFVNDPDALMSISAALNPDQYAVIPMPMGSESQCRYLENGFCGLAVAANSEHPDEAFEFLKYMVSAEVNTAICELYGALPVNKYAYENSEMFKQPIYEAWANEMADEHSIFVRFPLDDPRFSEYASTYHLAALQSYLLGQSSVDEFIQTCKAYWVE